MRNLNHPNIIRLHDFQETREYYYLIMDFAAGGELFHQIVRLTYFSEDLSRHVIGQVAEAIRYLHEEKGVVHRDIKPENLLFEPIPIIPSKVKRPVQPGDEDKEDEGEFNLGYGGGGIGKIMLGDFGLSKVVWESNTMTPCGTVGYTAPEIVKDERYSKSVDMWALGCVLFTLLCGFPPFYDESIQALTEKVARGEYTFLSPWWDEISKSVKDLISNLLTVDPYKRYTISQFLAHPWMQSNLNQATTPADDAPPTAFIERKEFLDVPASPLLPLTAGHQLPPKNPFAPKTPDFRSPGEINMKELFDVTYAVHRIEEESAVRKRGLGGTDTRYLNPIEDEDEDETNEYDTLARDFASKGSIDEATRKKRVIANAPQRHRRTHEFELNMNSATLLNRRHKVEQE